VYELSVFYPGELHPKARAKAVQAADALTLGFADRERMRRAFIRTFGLPPQAFRRRAQLGKLGAG
jgi:AraC-like DNA-binding protein